MWDCWHLWELSCFDLAMTTCLDSSSSCCRELLESGASFCSGRKTQWTEEKSRSSTGWDKSVFLVRLDTFKKVYKHLALLMAHDVWGTRTIESNHVAGRNHFLWLTCTSCGEKTPSSAFAASRNSASPCKSLEFFILSDEGDCLSGQPHVNSSWLRRRQKTHGKVSALHSSKKYLAHGQESPSIGCTPFTCHPDTDWLSPLGCH